MKALTRHRTEVAIAAARLDVTINDMGRQVEGLRAGVRGLAPGLVIGVGLAAGFLLTIVPKRWRGAAIAGLGQFALARLLASRHRN